ncbi:MAG TPA: ankyrin repeat domain-containing protein [Phycisphaerales bacterium]|nr:ankyrin repeat domain-containing protein [Phycisphaerales bacterium]
MCSRTCVIAVAALMSVVATSVLASHVAAQTPLSARSTLCVEPQVLDFGEIATGSIVRRAVKLTNTGDQAIVITSTRSSCGCTHAELPPNLTLEPGESREVTVPLSAGTRIGPLNGPTIIFLVKDQPEVKLPLKAVGYSVVVQEPGTLTPEANPDGCLTLKSIDGQPFRMLSMSPPLLTELPRDAAAEHVVRIDWAKYREQGITRRLVFYFDHPRCQSLAVNVKFSEAELETARNSGCNTPSSTAVAPGASDALGDVQELIAQGRNERVLLRIVEGVLDINARNAQGLTLLALAARSGNVDLMQSLLNAGADIEALDNSGRTPLMHAAMSKCPQAVRLLLEREARISARDSIGGTALTWAAAYGDAACVQALLEAGAEVEVVGRITGWTPLIWAAGYNDSAVVQMLILHGANFEAADFLDGATPLIHAARSGKIESMRTLIHAGANIEQPDANGFTPLLALARSPAGDAAKLRLLIDAGANLYARDARGLTALQMAQRRTDPLAAEVVRLLTP